MLKTLNVDNYALINNLSIQFDKGLSIITGETGAGKSILLGALGLVLGQRADMAVLSDKNRKCIVEGVFLIQDYDLNEFFLSNDLDYDDNLVMRREISPQGKSRAFINDTPVNLNQMKELGELLMDIHSQHSAMQLGKRDFQLAAVDAFAGLNADLAVYTVEYLKWTGLKIRYADLKQKSEQQHADEDYLNFLFQELHQTRLAEGELQNLESQLELLRNAESIKSDLYQVYNSLLYGDDALLSVLKRQSQLLQRNAGIKAEIGQAAERFSSILIELQDIANELEKMEQSIEADPVLLAETEVGLDQIYRLLNKHKLRTDTELIQLREDILLRLSNINNLDDELLQLEKSLKQSETLLWQFSATLTKKRKGIFTEFENEVIRLLKQMGMPHVQFMAVLETSEVLREDGSDELRFLFNANKGGHAAELNKIASGGEVSRIMLAVKSLIAGSIHLPSLIFDEIDTGVSGEMAGKLADILVNISKNMQLIVITHNPQVASRGKRHFKVYKEESGEHTQTMIQLLDNDEREAEIARMFGGEHFTNSALLAARELITGSSLS